MSTQTPGPVRIAGSLYARARQDDRQALEVMFRQFLSPEESIHDLDYLGVEGLFGIGKRSFVCLTDRRICALSVGFSGNVLFNDGYLEDLNGGVAYQPSLLGLYALLFVASVLAVIFTFGLGLLLLPFVAKLYYRFNKCGSVWVIREGVSVYVFANRSRLTRSNRIHRQVAPLRDDRLRLIRARRSGQSDPKGTVASAAISGRSSSPLPTEVERSGPMSLAACLSMWVIIGLVIGVLRFGVSEGVYQIAMNMDTPSDYYDDDYGYAGESSSVEGLFKVAGIINYPGTDWLDQAYDDHATRVLSNAADSPDDDERRAAEKLQEVVAEEGVSGLWDKAYDEEFLYGDEDPGGEAMFEDDYGYRGPPAFVDEINMYEVPKFTEYRLIITACVVPCLIIGLVAGLLHFAFARRSKHSG